jgi:ketosteroid isomerase-like protein
MKEKIIRMLRLVFIALLTWTLSTSATKNEADLNHLVDNWHLAAAQANLSTYTAFMDDSFVFLGTAPEERWDKTTFIAFCKPHFDKGKAWDFKATKRHWSFSTDKKTAWFDETLDTWMRDCRATGVLIKTKKGWKIAHYNLHVLIENEKMDAFLELRKKRN